MASSRKGETFELRMGLVSQYPHERKDAIQKTIMAMTLGKDVSSLFPDVLKNISSGDIPQKKLVYLYLMNYAKSHPDLCILAVNTFVQDSEHPNPLIRALAIRTMGCIRVDKILDYMCEPLRKTLADDSPYVRKTAVICVAKLFELDQEMCIENGFIETVQDLVGDSNPMVVANSVTTLIDIHESAPELGVFIVTSPTLKKMLLALNECAEWGRIKILSSLATYQTNDAEEGAHICERVAPQLQHTNPSVVLAAVKAMLLQKHHLDAEQQASYLKKMAPPLVTLVSSAPEVQYVALRNINLLLQAQPDILNKEMRVFFCKYNDPPYLKLEKLEIMVRIANEKNFETLLAELKEYAMEVDMDFCRRSIKAIGQVATTVEAATEKCVEALLDLIATGVSYVIQEVIVVIKDVFRRYSGYEHIIPTLCQHMSELHDAEARGSFVWIVGEYCEKLDEADEILSTFVDNFNEEFTQTQLQIVTAVVKLFLKQPERGQSLVSSVLQKATAENDNPDIRDRAYVYWRLLSSDTNVARDVVLAPKPAITTTIKSLPKPILDQLLGELSTLASVYHKLPGSFVGHGKFGAEAMQKAAIEEQQQNAKENPIAAVAVATANGTTVQQSNIESLLDLEDAFSTPAPLTTNNTGFATGSGLNDLMGGVTKHSTGPVSAQANSSFSATVEPNPFGELSDIFQSTSSAPSNGTSNFPSDPFAQLGGGFADSTPSTYKPPGQSGNGGSASADLLDLL